MLSESCSIIIVVYSVIIARLIVDPDLAGNTLNLVASSMECNRNYIARGGVSQIDDDVLPDIIINTIKTNMS